MDDEFRVEVELDDDEHGYSIGERLRALDLDDDARERLGSSVLVTRDGSRLFLYAASEPQAREAERVVREPRRRRRPDRRDRRHALASGRGGRGRTRRSPCPRRPAEEQAEEAARGAAEAEEARAEGRYDWEVVAHLPSRDEAVELAARLEAEGIPALRRWRYVVAGAVSGGRGVRARRPSARRASRGRGRPRRRRSLRRRARPAAVPPLLSACGNFARRIGAWPGRGTTRSSSACAALMGERGLDALVVRAPDNVLYLTNFWGMKGYDACVFPREGEPVLICLEASAEDAARTAWTCDVRLFAGYDPAIRARRPRACSSSRRRPPREYGRVGLELSLGTQAADRMVGEPTTFTRDWFDAFGDGRGRDAAPRRGPRAQDRAGDRAHAARERDRRRRDGALPA